MRINIFYQKIKYRDKLPIWQERYHDVILCHTLIVFRWDLDFHREMPKPTCFGQENWWKLVNIAEKCYKWQDIGKISQIIAEIAEKC